MTRRRSRPWTVTLLAGVGVAIAARELPFVNWQRVVPPVDARPLTIRHDAKGDGRFGAPRSGHRSHRGIDLVAPLHSPVRAIRSGRVVEVGTHKGLGRFIRLQHPGRLHSLYAHLEEVKVKSGARVRQGEVIGTVGKTGNARHAWITPHLHLEVLQSGTPLDPKAIGLIALAPGVRDAPAHDDNEEDEDAGGG